MSETPVTALEPSTVEALIQEQNYAGLREELYKMHPADIAELFRNLPLSEQVACFKTLESTIASLVILSLDEHILLPLMETLSAEELVPLLVKLPSDEAVDILNYLEDDIVRQTLDFIPDLKQAANLKELLSYPENSAGGIMSYEFIKIYKDMTAEDTLNFIRVKAEKNTVNFYYLYVVDRQDHLVGVVSLRNIITSPAYMSIESIMNTDVISVNHYDDEEIVAAKVQKYQVLALPVIDNQNRLKGIVTWDDATYVINRELAEDYFISSGISTADENAYEGALLHGHLLKAVRTRVPWLFVTMLGSMLAVMVGNSFQGTIDAVPTLAIFMPLLGGLGGNVGTQSSAMIVRGLAIGQVDASKPVMYILSQAFTGLIIGALFGLIIGGFVYFWKGTPLYGLILGAGLFANITIGATMGTLVPIMFKKLNLDPAIASGPFISTAIDITGLTIYFGFATIALQQLHMTP